MQVKGVITFYNEMMCENFSHGSNTVFQFLIGSNRFEVTLEKSNKNFSKKIQQVHTVSSHISNCEQGGEKSQLIVACKCRKIPQKC